MTVQKLATWIPVTNEMLADSPYFRLGFEYSLIGRRKPLTTRERITGWRWFTSSDGLTSRFAIGWRLALWDARRVTRCALTGHHFGPWEHDDDAWFSRECECRTRRESKEVAP